MTAKFKKSLKKTLIKMFIESKNSSFLIENRSAVSDEKPISGSCTYLSGSTVIEFNENYCSTAVGLRLPAILKRFQNFEILGSNILKCKGKGSFSIFALIKKGNLIVKSPMCNLLFRVENRRKCINMVFLKNVAFLITRRLY